jgi:hypothetical protein
MLAVCLAEILSIPFVQMNVWYAAAGFIAGSFIGYLITQVAVLHLFSAFEYRIFRNILLNAQ